MSVPQSVLDQVRYDQSVGARNTPSTGPMRSAQNLLNSWLGRTKPVPTPAAAQVARDQAAGARALKAYTQGKSPNLLQRLNPLATQTTQMAGARGILGQTLNALGTGLSVGAQTSLYTPIIYGGLSATKDALQTDRGKAFSQSVTSGNYGEALRHLTGAYNRTPGLTPVLPDESSPNPFLKKTGDKGIEVTDADGNPVELDMNNPADVERLQQIQPKVPERVTTEPATAPVPERDNMAGKTELERMTAWVNANKGLAEKVKPGQAGYEEIQIALGRAPYFESQIDPQAFASDRVKNFSDTLKMETVMPEGTTLGVADDLDEAYAKVSDPAFTEAIQKAFASGVNFATGARASKSPIKGTKPSQPFFEARTPGL